MHDSVLVKHSIELINITPLNPLISKCQIKVCYVGDEPNRNKSIITREVAKQMANSLPGSPIVGYYNEDKEDFEEHNKIIDIKNRKFKLKDKTQPYGFVDLNAKVWFAKYIDDDTVEREYLVTEGYLWTGQYPEARRVIEEGNNQSMELDDKIINAYWTKDNKGKPEFFIINEAIISKLCILGEENEPCFEGANITSPTLEFAFEDSFKQQLFSMMEEIKNILNKGGASVMNTYAVQIGDSLWNQIYDYLDQNYSESENSCSYLIEGVYEEEGQKYVILQNRSSGKYYQLNFELNEEDVFSASNEMVEMSEDFTPSAEAQFSLEAINEFEATRYQVAEPAAEPAVEPEEEPAGDPVAEPAAEPVAAYVLEEIPEYVELLARYNELETNYSALMSTNEELTTQNGILLTFKKEIERKDKENMIKSFYMRSDEDKKDVIENIDTYSVDDIEAKLSVICVRNKVSFSFDDDDNNNNDNDPMVYNVNGNDEDASIPAWLKAVQAVAENM